MGRRCRAAMRCTACADSLLRVVEGQFRRRDCILEPVGCLDSKLQVPGITPAMASRRSFSKNGLLIMKSTPGSGLPELFNISA